MMSDMDNNNNEQDENHVVETVVNESITKETASFFPTLYNSESLCDVKLIVGDTVVYSAHKVILASSSETFRTMFSSGFLECGMEEIVVSVGQPEVFETFLQYIYGFPIEISNLNTIALYEFAEYYQVNSLKPKCEDIMSKFLDPAHVCYIYAATSLGNSELAQRCLDRIYKMDYNALPKAPGFIDLPLHCITNIVSTTRIFSYEDSVYNALRGWLNENECDQESLLSLIHYDLIASTKLESIREEVAQYPSIVALIDEALKTPRESSERRGVLGDFSHPADSALDILQQGYSRGDGVYWININGRPSSVYCDMTFEGGGWMLVRRQKPGRGWQDNPSDKLQGAVEYGYEPDDSITPTVQQSFGITFNSLPFTQFQFKTGDGSKWLICHRDQVQKGWTYGGYVKCTIDKSYEQDGPYAVDWCKRHANVEDPWISAKTHHHNGSQCNTDSDQHSMLYGAQVDLWGHHVENDDGCNVWIR
jgi:tetratricopeptide (TPR) repeat protein